MSMSWLLILTIVHMFCLLDFLDGYVHGWSTQEAPSCEELRSLWDATSRSLKMSEFTNEIPLMPWTGLKHHQALKNARGQIFREDPPKTETFMKNIHPSSDPNVLPSLAAVPEITYFDPVDSAGASSNHEPEGAFGGFHGPFSQRSNMKQQASINHEPNGVFGGFHESFSQRPNMKQQQASISHEPNGVFGSFQEPFSQRSILKPQQSHSRGRMLETKKKGGGEMSHNPSWGAPEEVGMFGRFMDLDEDLALFSGSPDSSHHLPSFPVADHSRELDIVWEPCFQTLNTECSVDTQCTCSDGWNRLHCYRGKCTSRPLTEKEIWHEGPLPRSELGLFQKFRKRNKESIAT